MVVSLLLDQTLTGVLHKHVGAGTNSLGIVGLSGFNGYYHKKPVDLVYGCMSGLLFWVECQSMSLSIWLCSGHCEDRSWVLYYRTTGTIKNNPDISIHSQRLNKYKVQSGFPSSSS